MLKRWLMEVSGKGLMTLLMEVCDKMMFNLKDIVNGGKWLRNAVSY